MTLRLFNAALAAAQVVAASAALGDLLDQRHAALVVLFVAAAQVGLAAYLHPLQPPEPLDWSVASRAAGQVLAGIPHKTLTKADAMVAVTAALRAVDPTMANDKPEGVQASGKDT